MTTPSLPQDPSDQGEPELPGPPPPVPGPAAEPWGQAPAYAWADAPLTPGPPADGTNGQAIAAFVLGLLAIAPVSVVLGIVALVRIGRTRQRGKGLAIAGLVLSGAWCAVAVAAIMLGAVYVSSHPDALSPSPGMRLVSELSPGTCFDVTPDQAVTNWVTVVSCIQPHDRQLYDKIDFHGAYPGQAESRDQSQAACVRALGTAFIDPLGIEGAARLFFYAPAQSSYLAGGAQAWCTLSAESGRLSGNLMQSSGDYTTEQLGFLKATEQTVLLRTGVGAMAVGDLPQAQDFAAQLARVDRAEARQLLGMRFSEGTERSAAAVIARDDLAEAPVAQELASAATEAGARALVGRLMASSIDTDMHALRVLLGLDAA